MCSFRLPLPFVLVHISLSFLISISISILILIPIKFNSSADMEFDERKYRRPQREAGLLPAGVDRVSSLNGHRLQPATYVGKAASGQRSARRFAWGHGHCQLPVT